MWQVKKTSYSVLQINYLQNLHKWLTNTFFPYIMNSVNIYFIWFYIKCVQLGFGRSYIQHHISRFRLRWLRHSSFICWCNSVCHSVMAVLRQRMALRLRIEILYGITISKRLLRHTKMLWQPFFYCFNLGKQSLVLVFNKIFLRKRFYKCYS